MSSPNKEKAVVNDEEKALPDDQVKQVVATKEPKSPAVSKWKLYLVLGVFLLAGIVVAITVPLVRDDDSSDLSDSSDSSDLLPNDETPDDGKTGPNVTITPFSIFDVKLSNFNERVLAGYDSEEDFAEDCGDAVRTLLDRVVARNLGKAEYDNVGMGGGFRGMDDSFAEAAPEAAPSDTATATADKDSGRSPVGDDVDDYGTNNQEEGVEEGDIVMANKDYLFAAYGDHVVVWNPATGDQVATIKLPALPTEDPNIYEEPEPEKPREEPFEETGDGTGEEWAEEAPPEEPDRDPSTRRRDSMMYYARKASIQSMLLLETNLVVVASGYNTEYSYSSDHVIDSYLGTRIFVYDISDIGNAAVKSHEAITSKDVNGYFVSVRAIRGNVHLVTTSSINYYERLVAPFEKYNDKDLAAMSEKDYVATVIERANSKVIPDFVSALMDDIRVDGELPNFAKINTWDDGDGEALSPWLYPQGYMQSLAFVYSFDIASVASKKELTGVSAAGAILPAYGPNIYAATDIMIIATSGMGYSERHDAMVQKTYLVSFKLSGASSEPYTIGSVFGNILNQYSMDVVGGILRIATTIQRVWFWGVRPLPEPGIPREEPDVGEDIATDAEPPEEEPNEELTRDDETDTEESTSTATAQVKEDDGDSDGGDDEPDVWEESTTENYIITIDIDGIDDDKNATTPSVMQQLDEHQIGKPQEVITAVRFYDKYAYAVTFERKDPFYKLDVSNARNITRLAEIDITGFSQYLHSIDDNDEMILAIGQEADDNGMILGLQVSLFDMRDNKNPKVIRHNIEVNPSTYSYSDALWDKNAVRYNKQTGLLIIPVNMDTYPDKGHFNGFKLFQVTENTIIEDQKCSVEFGAAFETNVQYYCAWLPPRAMIFGGSMVTMKEHYIARTDLDTCGREWVKEVKIEAAETDMCWY